MENQNKRHTGFMIGGITVLILGILVVGANLFFSNPVFADDKTSLKTDGGVIATQMGPYQEVTIDLTRQGYTPIVVQKGIPVKFNIRATADAITSCNGTVVLPEFNKKMTLAPGDNVIEFTPQQSGQFGYACWMGMVNSSILVVDDVNHFDSSAVQPEVAPNGSGSPCCKIN